MRALSDRILDLLYPRHCVTCHRGLEPQEGPLCPDCAKALPQDLKATKRGDFYKRCVSVCEYVDPYRRSVWRYKFEGCSFYAAVYGKLLARVVRKELDGKFDCITFVPVSAWRLRMRGYDQARLLAEALGRELDTEVIQTVRKIRNNKKQSGISNPAVRRANVANAYRVVSPERVSGKRLLLIDDVLTTGATLTEVSRLLLTYGAESVYCGTFAVTPKQKSR